MRCRFSADMRQTRAEDCSLNMSCKKKVHHHKYEPKMFFVASDFDLFFLPVKTFDKVEWTTGGLQFV